MSEKYLCLIPARAGSKRLPGKNLLVLNGRPLLAHTIEQAKQAKVFTTIAVSSDSAEILSAAKTAGADLLIKRPSELASDEASSLDVAKHAIKIAEEKTGRIYMAIVLLQVTSPLRLPGDIQKAIALFEERPVGSLLSVVAAKNGNIQGRYNINGSIYIWDKERFLSDPQHLYPDSRLMLMPASRSIDIDYQKDFDLAIRLMEEGEYAQGEAKALN